MAGIKIVTDSSACLSREYCEEHDIAVMQLSYTFEGETAHEGAPEDWDAFYERFAASGDFPKTSQAGMHGFLNAFEQALGAEGYDSVVCMTITAGVSGTYHSAVTAAGMVDAERIHVINSKGGGSSLKMLVLDTVERIAQGMDVRQVVELAERDVAQLKYQFTPGSLEYLRRGGRISKAMAMLGGALKILPLIELVDGEMTVAERIRGGQKKVVDSMIARLPERVRKIGISHVLALELAKEVEARLREKFPNAAIRIDQMNPVIGCHLGPGALGIAALCE
ncbi:MAG: DegV family protein [Candidatus Spyradocola sp.]